MHKLATGQFAEASNPIARPQNGGHPSVQNPPPLEDIPKAPVGQGTPWPNTQSTSENLFETQKDWPIPPAPVPTSASHHEDRSTTPGSSNCQSDGHPQTSYKQLHMGTAQPHLQKLRRTWRR